MGGVSVIRARFVHEWVSGRLAVAIVCYQVRAVPLIPWGAGEKGANVAQGQLIPGICAEQGVCYNKIILPTRRGTGRCTKR
jgi:hypothetical protein